MSHWSRVAHGHWRPPTLAGLPKCKCENGHGTLKSPQKKEKTEVSGTAEDRYRYCNYKQLVTNGHCQTTRWTKRYGYSWPKCPPEAHVSQAESPAWHYCKVLKEVRPVRVGLLGVYPQRALGAPVLFSVLSRSSHEVNGSDSPYAPCYDVLSHPRPKSRGPADNGLKFPKL